MSEAAVRKKKPGLRSSIDSGCGYAGVRREPSQDTLRLSEWETEGQTIGRLGEQETPALPQSVYFIMATSSPFLF